MNLLFPKVKIIFFDYTIPTIPYGKDLKFLHFNQSSRVDKFLDNLSHVQNCWNKSNNKIHCSPQMFPIMSNILSSIFLFAVG